MTVLAMAGLLLTAGAARDSEPVVRVGQTSLDRGQLEAWLNELVPAQWVLDDRGRASVANTVRDILVPELLLAEHAASELAGDPAFQQHRDQALSIAFERMLEQTVEVSEDEIREFYERHADRYIQPHAILLWRILAPDEATATRVIDAVRDKRLGVYEWGNLAREHSIDEATKHRDGSLGFVRSDGTTDVPQVRVSAELFRAADAVADGQLVETPVPEGAGFAVIWRRGTRESSRRSLDAERENIAAIVARHRLQVARQTMVEDLRKQQLNDFHPELLEAIHYELPETVEAQESAPRTAPEDPSGTASTAPARGAPEPKASERGER